MPFIRKTGDVSPPAAQDARLILQALASPVSEDRWMAARAATELEDADLALSQALRTETDPRVREAMFTGLARIGTPVAVESLLSMLRSDSASLRTGALDALRMLRSLGAVASQLLRDADPDVRILSCELARSLPAAEASGLLCELLAGEQNVNVCAAAIEVLAEVGGPEALATLADCAGRFRSAAFLQFAISAVRDRINVKSASTRD
jgi:HEAT repeat protein